MDLNQITLPAINIDESVSFYQTLGFKQIVAQPDYARFESVAGNSTFSIHKANQICRESGFIVYFETNQLQTLVKTLKSKGITFEQEPIKQPWLWEEAYLKDPSGNNICLYFAGENRKNPPWRIKD